MNTRNSNQLDNVHPSGELIELGSERLSGNPNDTYRHWVDVFGKQKADKIADCVGLTQDERKLD